MRHPPQRNWGSQVSSTHQVLAHSIESLHDISSNWKWPSIEGLSLFEGKKLHSARWDDSYDFTDKVVAVIGAGSSAIQIVPSLLPSMPQSLKILYSALTDATYRGSQND